MHTKRIRMPLYWGIVLWVLLIGVVCVSAQVEITANENPFSFSVSQNGQKLLESVGPISLQHVWGAQPVKEAPYIRWKGETKREHFEVKVAVPLANEGRWKRYHLLNDQGTPLILFRYRSDTDIASFEFEEIDAPKETIHFHSRISVSFASEADDSYLGMGMRFNKANHRGTIVNNWADEVGANAPIIARNGTPEGRDLTYYPVPFFLNLKGYGFLLDSFYYSRFDFASSNPDRITITNYSNSFHGKIFLGDRPLDIVSNYSKHTGNYRKPPPWAFGVWAAASADWQSVITGQEVNEQVLKAHRENDIPLSAIMAEDWYWSFFTPRDAWKLNTDEYPDYAGMIEDQHNSGVNHIGYFLPYIDDNLGFQTSPRYLEAANNGYFTKDSTGKAYLFDFAIWTESQLDVTNPEAVNWFQEEFYQKAVDYGVDGWMNDFGEYTPYDSYSHNGELGLTMHNKYPLLWADAAKSFWLEDHPEKDHVLFSRSGFIGQQSNVDFHFTGDRNATYEPFSGFGGQIPGMLTAGISAHPNTSVDIGAYNCDETTPMDKLMTFRWIELGALVPVMRLHRGLPLCDHWRFDEDRETLLQWKKYAKLHIKLFPYIYSLAQQAEDHGWPMVRHLSLHYPDDPTSLEQEFQFLLGDRILSAPVIRESQRSSQQDMSGAKKTWRVYLPPGNWYHYWSQKRYAGNRHYDIAAEPGSLPFFVQEGKIVPTYDRNAHTLVRNVEDPTIKDFESIDKSIQVDFYGYGSDEYQLWDGTIIRCSRKVGETGTCEMSNSEKRVYSSRFINDSIVIVSNLGLKLNEATEFSLRKSGAHWFLQSGFHGAVDLSLRDVAGKVLLHDKRQLNGKGIMIDLPVLSPALYFFEIKDSSTGTVLWRKMLSGM